MKHQFPWAVSLLLDKRKPKAQNVLIGSDRVVIRALEQKFGCTIERWSLDSNQGSWFFVDADTDIPEGDRGRFGFWSNPPISKNRELLDYVVSVCSDLKKEQRDEIVSNLMYESESIRDFYPLYWAVQNQIVDPKRFVWTKNPWESKFWLGEGDVSARLAWLYTDLLAYVYAKSNNKEELTSMNISPKKIAYLSSLKLSNKRVTETFGCLSRWKRNETNSIQTSFLISCVWS
jgi:hypothetical protein